MAMALVIISDIISRTFVFGYPPKICRDQIAPDLFELDFDSVKNSNQKDILNQK